jgi:hypothetical protein
MTEKRGDQQTMTNQLSDKSLDHTYSVGERVFDLPSEQMVTILKVTLVRQPDPFVEEECIECQSAKCISADDIDTGLYGDEDLFVVTVDALPVEDWPDGKRIFGEFCLPEEAKIHRGFECMLTEEARRDAVLRSLDTIDPNNPENDLLGQMAFDVGIPLSELPERCINDQHFMHGYNYAKQMSDDNK